MPQRPFSAIFSAPVEFDASFFDSYLDKSPTPSEYQTHSTFKPMDVKDKLAIIAAGFDSESKHPKSNSIKSPDRAFDRASIVDNVLSVPAKFIALQIALINS